MKNFRFGKEARPLKSFQATLEILIVDDDKVLQLLHARSVKDCHTGHPVTIVEGGEHALDHIENNKKVFQNFLVLLDLNMPGMNGWELLEECRIRNLQNVYIVIVTSSIRSEDKFRIFDFPQVLAYCEKPFSKNKMQEILDLKELKSIKAFRHNFVLRGEL